MGCFVLLPSIGKRKNTNEQTGAVNVAALDMLAAGAV